MTMRYHAAKRSLRKLEKLNKNSTRKQAKSQPSIKLYFIENDFPRSDDH